RQMLEAHMVVHRAIARLMAVRATDSEIEQLAEATSVVRAAIDRRSPAEIAFTNAHLHRLEATVARNDQLRGLAWSIYDQGQRLSYLCFGGERGLDANLSEHYASTSEDHDESLEAVRAGDADAAEAIAARHVRLFRQRVLQFLETDQT